MGRLSNINERTWFWLSFAFFAVIYASITFVNHYVFRTSAYDLGINNNAIYDYAHFRWNDSKLMDVKFDNVLGDHFSLLPIIVSPLYWLFGSYTMLIVQYAGILFGGYGIYKYCKLKTSDTYLPVLAMTHFFAIWGIYSALSFDYHDNVMAAMFVPWLFYYFDKQQWKGVALFFVLILISKENMALWMSFLAPGLGIMYRQNKKMLGAGLLMGAFAAAYFAFIVKIVIPDLSNSDKGYLHFNYDALGSNFSEAFTTIVTRPVYSFKLLFFNHSGNPYWGLIKFETHLMVILAGGWAFLYRPYYLFMLIPVFAQKLYSNDTGKWGINGHYSIEFAPIIALAVFEFLRTNEKKLPVAKMAILVCAVTFASTIWKLDNRWSKYYMAKPARFFTLSHYKQTMIDIPELYRAINIVPDDAKVSAVSFIVPHMAFRDYIYQYPYVFDAEYIVFALDPQNPYPLSTLQQMEDTINAYRHKPNWEVVYDKNSTLIVHIK